MLKSQVRGLQIGAIDHHGPIEVIYGEIVRVSLVRFQYRGPAMRLFVCWGLKAGTGEYHDGANLALSGAERFASAGIDIVEALEFRAAEVTVRADLRILPPLPAGRTYDAYVWLSRGIPSMRQADMVELTDGAGQAPDTDSSVVQVLSEEVQAGQARGLQVRYVRA